MKKLFAAAFAVLFASQAFAEVKDYVGVVRQSLYPAYDEFLSELSESLKSRGYSTYADYADSYRKGGFGSGFVFVDADGANYVITNRHVVSHAASASIEFERADGSTVKYGNLSVLICDDDIDLAILRFEGSAKPFKEGLPLFSGALSDGEDVVSAGFPGLGGGPVWQFGKGSVTNATARIKDLIDPAISAVIQHSAQVDAGNSGGPLLVAQKSSATGYAVAGVNTWKAAGRESTNFAIPARLVRLLIDRAKQPTDDEAAQSARSEKFRAALTDMAGDWAAIAKFISYDFALREGEDAFDEIMRYGATKVRNRVLAEFAQDPLEGLRAAVAFNVYEALSGENATEENLGKVTWQKEHGLFRVFSIDGNDDTDKKKAKKSSKSTKSESGKNGAPAVSFEGIESPCFLSFGLGGVFPFSGEVDGKNVDLSAGLDFALSLFPGENGIFGMFAEYEKVKIEGINANAFGVGVLLRIPLNFNLFTVSPKAGAGIKMGGGEPKIGQIFWEAGIETNFNLGVDYIRPGLDVAYRSATDKFSYYETSDPDMTVKCKILVVRFSLAISME